VPAHRTQVISPSRWGHALADGGGVIELVTPDAIRIACAAWGFGRCGGAPAGRPRR